MRHGKDRDGGGCDVGDDGGTDICSGVGRRVEGMVKELHFLRENFGSEVASLVEQHTSLPFPGGRLGDVNYAQVALELELRPDWMTMVVE